jgi:hypothetical protein
MERIEGLISICGVAVQAASAATKQMTLSGPYHHH